jgi:signal transduction histidine kinase
MTAGPSTILVVDGEAAGRSALQSALRGMGLSPVFAGGALEARRAVRERRPDLVLLDIDLHGPDGIGIFRQLEEDSVLAEVPVIFLSTREASEEPLPAFAAGAADYLRKPFQIQELRRRIETQLELARLRSGLESRTSELAESLAKREQVEKSHHDLLHKAAHDMRSPIMAVSGYLELLNEGAVDAESQREFVERARDGTATILRLIDAMVDLSRLERNRGAILLQRHEFQPLVERALGKLGVFAVRRVAVEVPRGLFVQCDDGLLVRVVANLLADALKYSEENEQVVARSHVIDDGWIRLLIESREPGARLDPHPQLLETFEMGSDAGPGGSSYGLGLTFCKLAIRLQGGHIGVCESSGSPGVRSWLALSPGADPLPLPDRPDG